VRLPVPQGLGPRETRASSWLGSVEDVRTFRRDKRGLRRLPPILRRTVQDVITTLAAPEFEEMVSDLRELMTHA